MLLESAVKKNLYPASLLLLYVFYYVFPTVVLTCMVPEQCLMACSVCVSQGEEGPPSLEYIKAKDLFPQKELVKEDESLQVSLTLLINH